MCDPDEVPELKRIKLEVVEEDATNACSLELNVVPELTKVKLEATEEVVGNNGVPIPEQNEVHELIKIKLEASEDEINNALVPDLIIVKDEPDEDRPITSVSNSIPALKDGIEETLRCPLCLEILHDAVCLQPCLHCYCAGCYSQWMKKSSNCPQCRNFVESLSKNHIVSNLVEAFLQSHPEKKRSAADIEKLNQMNTVKSDIMYFQKKNLQNQDDDSNDSNSSSDSGHTCFTGLGGLYYPIPSFGMATCRQCPTASKKSSDKSNENKKTKGGSDSNNSKNVPSTSSDSLSSQNKDSDRTKLSDKQCSDDFHCKSNQLHIPCQCCQQLMPDRRAERAAGNLGIPPQQCSVCLSSFCHLYFSGCTKVGCKQCLNEFKDLKFNDFDLLRGVNNNVIESRILLDYLNSSGKTWRICFDECLAELNAGRFTMIPALKSDSIVCHSCGLRHLKTLLYLYRSSLPRASLSTDVTSRPDCYWGKNCRTQVHKMTHAERFNHICEQTRF